MSEAHLLPLPFLTHQGADRMPVPIGNFISQHVYDRKLRTDRSITSPDCCRFVDVRNGKENRSGKSWVVSCSASVLLPMCRLENMFIESQGSTRCRGFDTPVASGWEGIPNHHAYVTVRLA